MSDEDDAMNDASEQSSNLSKEIEALGNGIFISAAIIVSILIIILCVLLQKGM